ncbi:hypothetical protein ANO14919_079230 [Xylariales sp. No.14919]|nr:hypothetical protein ANO14919_079230 [Xylariales sp. No.14919]
MPSADPQELCAALIVIPRSCDDDAYDDDAYDDEGYDDRGHT